MKAKYLYFNSKKLKNAHVFIRRKREFNSGFIGTSLDAISLSGIVDGKVKVHVNAYILLGYLREYAHFH
jgi:hypothetical protein